MNISRSHLLATELRNRIESGELVPGEALPSIRELSAANGVGRQVVLSAFQLLAEEGLIRSAVGRGTRVNPELAARQKCRIAYVILADNLRNNFYNALFTGLCLAAAGSGKEIVPYEDVTTAGLENIAADCILLTGQVSRSAVQKLEKRDQRCIVVGNYLSGYWPNNIRFATTPLVRRLLMLDTTHRKSVGILIDSVSYASSRDMINEVESYCQEFDLPWGATSAIATYSSHGLDEIRRIWGVKRNWQDRIVTTQHLFFGMAQFLTEQGVAPEDSPELLVILSGSSALPLPFPHLAVQYELTDEANCGPELLQCTIDYITGRLKDGFQGEYDPLAQHLNITPSI